MLPRGAPADGSDVEGHHLLVVLQVVQVDAGRLRLRLLLGGGGGLPHLPHLAGCRLAPLGRLLVLWRAGPLVPPPPAPLLRLLRVVPLREAVLLVPILSWRQNSNFVLSSAFGHIGGLKSSQSVKIFKTD